MFGPDTQIDLSLLELEKALPALQGVVMELEDCAYPLLRAVSVSADANAAFKDIDWALLIGSVPRKEGMERGDLLKINGNVFTLQGQALSAHAKPSCKVIVVGNPCNTNAYIAKSVCKNIPAKNFFAMTMLDQNRAQAQLAQKAGVAVDRVKNVAIWGNHSSTQYPDFYHATIDGRPAVEVISDEEWLKGPFMEGVQKRGAAIIKARGLSSRGLGCQCPDRYGTPYHDPHACRGILFSGGAFRRQFMPSILVPCLVFLLRSNGTDCRDCPGPQTQ